MDKSSISPKKWSLWWTWNIVLWMFPGGMLIIWSLFYCQVFGETPYGLWPATGIDILFGLNFLAIGLLIFLWRNHDLRLLITLPNILVEILVAWWIWYFGGMSVSGFYF
jgi:hypothetical protein